MIIRTATVNDINVLSHIHATSWKSAYKGIVPQAYLDNLSDDSWVNSFAKRLVQKELTAKVLLLENNLSSEDLPIGCLTYGKARDEAFKGWAEIVSFYFLPEFTHQGYGSLLLNDTLNELRVLGYKKVYLWVLKDNLPARHFYEKHHFICTPDETTCEIQGVPLVDIRYILKL